MIFHLQLYALADTLLVDSLKSLAQTQFQEIVEQDWNTDVFPDTIKRVYEITNPGTAGDQLRAIVVRIAAEHGRELMAQGGQFSMMMGEVAEFGRDVFQIMAGGAVALPLIAEKMVTYKCPACPFEFYAKAIERDEIACSGCSVVNQESEWRIRKNTSEGRKNGPLEMTITGTVVVDGNEADETEGTNEVSKPKANGSVIDPESKKDESEDTIEWNTMRANGECVKETTAVAQELKEGSQAPAALADGIGAEEDSELKVIGSESEKSLGDVNGVLSGNRGDTFAPEPSVNTIPGLTTDVVIEKKEINAPLRADSANGDGIEGGVEAKESGGEVEESLIVPKKAKKKKGKKASSAASALANGPTSPRATEAQIVGIVNSR